MPDEWYGSDTAQAIADQLVMRQMDNGGWQKNVPYHKLLDDDELAKVRRTGVGATIDNGATTLEMQFLAKVYGRMANSDYKASFLKALDYLLEAQYDNGGWPQFYPPRGNVSYSARITYNDDAFVNVMYMLRDIYEERQPYDAFKLSVEEKTKARRAFDNGVECILKTQIRQNGVPTVWCAQHDEHDLRPAPARSYELASFSGSESVGVVRLLMSLPDPSPEVIAAVDGAVAWFEAHAIKGYKTEKVKDAAGKTDIKVVPSAGHVMWARFYDLETGQPFFCDRDGVKKTSLSEIGYERRNGYSWYTTAPQRIIDAYPQWKADIQK